MTRSSLPVSGLFGPADVSSKGRADYRLKHVTAGVVASAFLGLSSLPSAAQQIVYDPQTHAEAVLTAARALEQVRNQLKDLELQARMLVKSGLDLSPDLQRSIAETRALLAAAEGLSFDLSRISGEIQALYPETWEAYDLPALLAQSDRWLAESHRSASLAMSAQARTAETMEAARARIGAALTASTGAEGQTSAVQAGNQLLGVSAGELAEIRGLLAAQGRALETDRLERIARETRSDDIRRRAFPEASHPAPPPARSAF